MYRESTRRLTICQYPIDTMTSEMTPPRRAYRKRRRAEQEDRTRRQITEAAVKLHGTVGPARTTIRDRGRSGGTARDRLPALPRPRVAVHVLLGALGEPQSATGPGRMERIADPESGSGTRSQSSSLVRLGRADAHQRPSGRTARPGERQRGRELPAPLPSAPRRAHARSPDRRTNPRSRRGSDRTRARLRHLAIADPTQRTRQPRRPSS